MRICKGINDFSFSQKLWYILQNIANPGKTQLSVIVKT